MYIAHSLQDNGTFTVHTLDAHLHKTAGLAAGFAASMGMSEYARLTGLLHDIGKSSTEFQRRIRGDTHMRVDHSTAGAVLAHHKYGNFPGKLLAYCIAGHHGGLPNGKDITDSCLFMRLRKQIPDYDSTIVSLPETLPTLDRYNNKESKNTLSDAIFLINMVIRMLYSCLVDADYLDTEAFMQPDKALLRQAGRTISQQHLDQFNSYIQALSAKSDASAINKIRTEILHHCINAGKGDGNIYTLSVPTGGGKTLSSMAFALNLALRRGMKRIIYVIPYTSIIEQNAAVFREIFNNDDILEHHSNYDYNKISDDNETQDSYRLRLTAQNWDSPIIVTTAVQFFESFFANKSSRCRKLHNVADSVIILDEAQMLNINYFTPCLTLLRLLAKYFNCVPVFCTATQPALASEHLNKFKIDNAVEIIPDHTRYFDMLKRVEVLDLGTVADSKLVDNIRQSRTALVVVNSRKHAYNLFNMLNDGLANVFHLSTLMCPAHRSKVLAEAKSMLSAGLPCILVSTQLIEAGVDIDFPVVFRAIAGADSIAQAAGRCNRNGRLAKGSVYIFDSKDYPAPNIFRRQIDNTRETMRHNADLLSPKAIEYYFNMLYWKTNSLDAHKILDKINEGATGELNLPFKDIADSFHLIDSDTVSVIIRYDADAEAMVNNLKNNFDFRSLQKYTVQLYRYEYEQISRYISTVDDSFHILEHKALYGSTGINIFEHTGNLEDYVI